ncbi:MAG: hypothetical protein ACW963_01500 [Candidatus Sifarchaeia archaeon]
MNKLALGKGRQQTAHSVNFIFFIRILLVVAGFLLIAIEIPITVVEAPCLFPAVITTHPCAAGLATIRAILWVVIEWHGAVTVFFFYDYYIVGPSDTFWVIGCFAVVGFVAVPCAVGIVMAHLFM